MPLIELMGLPGAGKSTIAADLFRERSHMRNVEDAYWSAARARPRGIIERLLLLLPIIVKMPLCGPMCRMDIAHLFFDKWIGFTDIVFREAASLQNPLHRKSFLYAWLKYAVQREMIDRYLPHSSWVLVEEGFAHRAMTLFGYSKLMPAEELICMYGKAMPKPSAILWIDTPPHICAKRLQERAEPPLMLISKSVDEWIEMLEVGRSVLATMARLLVESCIPVITVSSGSNGWLEEIDELFLRFE